jgi:hypothetical protein
MNNLIKQNIEMIIEKIEAAQVEKLRGIVGFDGFVDEVVHVVDKRYDADNYKRIETIQAYGERISMASGLSTNIEVVTIQKKLGGNGPIFANSLLDHGVGITYIGALGYPEVESVFNIFVQRCEAISLANPGYTDAVEFFDGKIIRSKLDALKDINWETLKSIVGISRYKKMLLEADFAAFVNWSLLINMNSIWQGLLKEVFPKFPKNKKKKLLIDLADPGKRSDSDLHTALDYIQEIGQYFDVILGLNKKEACEIVNLFGNTVDDYLNVDKEQLMIFLHETLAIDTIVIHSNKKACAQRKGEDYCVVDSLYCAKPKLTTGAGDNFNAGFVLGQICDLTVEESLYLAVCNSGFYVRNARSPKTHELLQFMRDN